MEREGDYGEIRRINSRINMSVSDETIAACVAVLNMHLKNKTSEALVERDENGICQIAVYNRETTEQ